MQSLIDKDLNSNDRILKPDFNSKTGRELLAFYLQTKFKQILANDKKHENRVFIEVDENFIPKFTKRLINTPQKHLLIGITGASASGKSTICREIKNVIEEFDMPVAVLSTDNYFKDISALINKYGSFDKVRDSGYDIDAPSSFQLDRLKEDLIDLSQGIDIDAPMYMPNGTGISIPSALHIYSEKIIVVEGIATMYEDVQDVFDIRIYIEAPDSIRKHRFVKRAVEERNQSEENALKHWNYLKNAGDKYVSPFRSTSDFIINGTCDLKYFAQILEYIHSVTNNFQE